VSNQPPTDQRADNKSKGTVEAEDKEVLVDLSNLDKKLWISSNLNPREVIEHKLGIDPLFKPIKQKERRYTTKHVRSFDKKSIYYSKMGSSGQ
jgi:hypothetical protein